jgi:predicted acylesterase/phospholipase RssA
VLFAATSANINHPQAFRTYSVRGSSLNPTIVEAVCATMAVPSFFLPVKIGPRLRQQSFIGGPLGANNPARELLKEASAIFGPNRRLAQVLSIGSGLPRVISMDSSADEESVHSLLKEIATDCEMVAQELSTRLYTVDAYLRLNVDRGMELVTMTDWNELGSIESHAAAYIVTAIVTGALDSSIRHLQERTGALTLEQISTFSVSDFSADLSI